MAVTFAVDDVIPTTTLRPMRSRAEEAGPVLSLGGDPALAVVDTFGFHPLVAAVHCAFAEHRRLVLSPDAVWLTIAQGVAQHVRLHAEALRPRLVRHAGTKRLVVPWLGPLPQDPESWTAIVDQFRHLVGEEIGGGRARLFVCDFSTSSPVDRVASEIVLMDAMSAYFDYELVCICGIPTVTVLGTPDDWRRIRDRVDVIAELELGHWTRSLAPIADQLVAAAEGRADPAFWRWIYKPRAAYGGDTFSGWLGRLFPYLEGEGVADRPNPLLELPFEQPRAGGPALRPADIPRGPSQAQVRVKDGGGAVIVDLVLDGGLTSVAQEPDGGLRPVSGFAVRFAAPSMPLVVERIRAEHRVTPRTSGEPITGPAELVALFGELDEATLFAPERAWHIRSPRAHTRIHLACGDSVTRLIDLPGSEYLARATYFSLQGSRSVYVRGRAEALAAGEHGRLRSSQSSADVDVVGESLAALLERALDADGDLALTALGRLDAHVAEAMSREREQALAAAQARTDAMRSALLSVLVARARA